MKTNTMLVVGAMVVGSLVATGCSDATDTGAQQETAAQQEQGSTTASAAAVNRFGWHGRAEGRFGRDRDHDRGAWGRGRGERDRGFWGRGGWDRDHDHRGWWDRARAWWR